MSHPMLVTTRSFHKKYSGRHVNLDFINRKRIIQWVIYADILQISIYQQLGRLQTYFFKKQSWWNSKLRCQHPEKEKNIVNFMNL